MKPTTAVRVALSVCVALAVVAPAMVLGQSPPGPRPRVLSVEPVKAGVDQRIYVKVDDLPTLIALAGGQCANVVLFLDGAPMPGLEPTRCNPDDGTVAYQLAVNGGDPNADAAWRVLMGAPDGLTRAIRLSVGPSADTSIDSDVRGDKSFQLVLLYPLYFYLWLGVTGLLVGGAVWLARRSNLLRDPYAVVPEGAVRPYSLSRFQAVFWCVLVLISFFLIWSITGELTSITGSVLGLLGIGSGTALGAAMIDSDKSGTKAVAAASKAAAAGAEPPVPELPVRSGGSEGFLRDILSGSDGISFHRFQMFVWTIVLGLIFCSTVYDTLSMPQFDASLLALLGISSGTYLGFKIPETHTTDAAGNG